MIKVLKHWKNKEKNSNWSWSKWVKNGKQGKLFYSIHKILSLFLSVPLRYKHVVILIQLRWPIFSGAGIGWLDADNRRAVQQQQSSSGPSPEYLRSLLNVNEALLAQSLANTSESSTVPVKVMSSSCPLPSPNGNNSSEPIVTNEPVFSTYTTPPITPDESQPLGTRLNYTHTMDPIAEHKASSSNSSSQKYSP